MHFKKIFTIGALFVMATGIFAALRREHQVNRDAFVKSFQESQDLLKSDSAEAIEKLEQTIMFSSSPEEAALAKVSLGVAHISGKDFESLKKGITVLKEVAAGELYPPYYRAGAATHIAGIYPSLLDGEFAQSHIFSGDPRWGSFIKDGDIDEAVRRAYEWANTLFPTARAHYNIALWYGRKLLEADAPPVYADLFKTNLKRGDNLLEIILSRGTLRKDAKELAFLFQLRGVSHALYYELYKTPSSKNVAETSFKLALATLDEDSAVSRAESARGMRLFIHYYYAIFLSRLGGGGDDSRGREIRELLRPIVKEQNKSFPFFSYLKNLGALSSDTHTIQRENALLLVRFDSPFRVLLKELGWKM